MSTNEITPIDSPPTNSDPTRKDNGNKISEVKNEIREWMLSTSAHGISASAKAESYCIMIAWLTLFCCSASYCFYSKNNF
jgi:hypothetical protein